MKRLTIPLFLGILLLGFFLRLYRFNNPIADWHSWRQVDTSSVSRNFTEKGFDILHPTYHDLSNVPSGLENPYGYRFVEFPIYNLFQAGGYKFVGIFSLEEWGRIVTILSSLLSVTFIFFLLRKYTDDKVALFSSFLYCVIPFNIYYGRVILPDPMMVTAILGAIYFFDLWINNGKKTSIIKEIIFGGLSIIFTASAFLLKPYALFFALPIVAIAYNAYGFSMFKKWKLWVYGAISIFPLVLWRIWMMNFPEGIPVSAWLLNGGNIRFKGAFFYWIFENRIGGLILTFWGAGLFISGILLNSNSEKIYRFLKGQMLIFWSFLASSLIYITIIARGNVQHDYYQILIMPTLVIFAGLGAKLFIDPPENIFKKYVSYPLLVVLTFFMIAFGWYAVRDYFNINNSSIIAAGVAADKLLPKDALVIANYEGDTTFLYQTKRSGWASYTKDLPEMIQMGADYLIIADPKETDFEFGNKYKIIDQKNNYLIIDLRNNL